MPLIRMLDAEQAHTVAVWAASLGLAPKVTTAAPEATTAIGKVFARSAVSAVCL